MEKQISVVICNKNSLEYLKKSVPAIKKSGVKIYYHKTDFSGEDPRAFRGISEILKPLVSKKLIKKVLLLKPIAILKG